MKLYTSKEFAEKIGVTTQTVVRWDKDGKLNPAGRTIGGHRRYTEEQINEIIKGVRNDG